MKNIIKTIICLTPLTCIFLFSCRDSRNSIFTSHPVFQVDYGKPTADKPQLKLWYAGKYWWALIPASTGPSLWQRTEEGWKEHTDVTKSLAGVQGRADVWAEDEKVMAVAVKDIKNTNHSISVFQLRMKIELSGIRWEPNILTELFPPSPDETIETATITRDSKGNWWTSAVAGTNVYIWNSSSEGMNWTDPILLARGVDLDDICVVTPLPNDEIGVIWSDQVRDAVLMRTHKDGNLPDHGNLKRSLTWEIKQPMITLTLHFHQTAHYG